MKKNDRRKRKLQEEACDYEIERTPTTRYEPDYEEGLTSAQAEEHRRDGWGNISVDPPAQTTEEIIKENVFTYFNLIFLVLAILLIIVGSFRNLTFLPVIIFNTLIGIIQEIRSKKTLEKLNMLNAPHATVVRDGKTSRVDSESLVLDDIVIFKAGNQVCADAEVVHGSVQVNESLLTGESDEITKNPGDHLMSGSFIVAGECHARLSFFFNGDPFRSSITSMVAAVIGMIPEGLYLLASVAMAVSAMRLAKQKVLLHDMKSIETLARVNVLCVDKTGTITETNMSVKDVVPTSNYKKDEMPELPKMLGDFAKAMSSDNITMEALKEYFKEGTGKKAESVTPFTSATKYSGVTYEEEVHVLGAPEFVLRDDFDKYKEEIEGYAGKGNRVLVFGTYDGELDGKALTGKVTPLGYVLLANPIRKEAPETFAYFAEQGVEVKVISGDNPLTVSEVAKEAGIANADRYVDAATLHSDAEIADAVANYTVFGRVTPDQKRKFVHALKDQGKTVAMTGDGVNDVLALKDADCSVAMASGSDAAVQASQVVLLESNFACMPSVVMEGRRVVNNIQRSASLFLVKNIFSFLLSLFSVVLMITYPMEPSQISLISMFTIGVPGFFLAFQPNKERIRGHFLTNVFLKALPAGLTDVLMVGALVVFGKTFDVNTTDISTAATMLLLIVGFIILFNICKPVNIFRGVVWGGCLTGCILCIIFLPKLFAITGMSTKCIMLFVVFSIATEAVLRYLTLLVKGLQKGYRKIRHREE